MLCIYRTSESIVSYLEANEKRKNLLIVIWKRWVFTLDEQKIRKGSHHYCCTFIDYHNIFNIICEEDCFKNA